MALKRLYKNIALMCSKVEYIEKSHISQRDVLNTGIYDWFNGL